MGEKSFTTTDLGRRHLIQAKRRGETTRERNRKRGLDVSWHRGGRREPLAQLRELLNVVPGIVNINMNTNGHQRAKQPTQHRQSVDRNAKTRLNRQGGGADRGREGDGWWDARDLDSRNGDGSQSRLIVRVFGLDSPLPTPRLGFSWDCNGMLIQSLPFSPRR